MSGSNLRFKMNLPEKLLAQAEEFRIYAAAECKPASKEQWIKWAETCEAAATAVIVREGSPTATINAMKESSPYKDLIVK